MTGGYTLRTKQQSRARLQKGLPALTDILPAVRRATEKSMPIIVYDRLMQDKNVFYITFDNVEVGRLQAREIMKKKPNGNYVMRCSRSGSRATSHASCKARQAMPRYRSARRSSCPPCPPVARFKHHAAPIQHLSHKMTDITPTAS
jgi:DNA-binding LacI/PurR family transcriptional regulator